MMFAVIDKKTRELLCFGHCNKDSFLSQRGTSDCDQQVIMIDKSLDANRRYKMWPDGEFEDIGISVIGEMNAKRTQK
jgi:hypothetical protein